MNLPAQVWLAFALLIAVAGCSKPAEPVMPGAGVHPVTAPSEVKSEPVVARPHDVPIDQVPLAFKDDVLGKMTIAQFQSKYARKEENVTYPIMSGDLYPGYPHDSVDWHKEANVVVGFSVAKNLPNASIADHQIRQAEYTFVDGKLAAIRLRLAATSSVPGVIDALTDRYGEPRESPGAKEWKLIDGTISATPVGTIEFHHAELTRLIEERSTRILATKAKAERARAASDL